MGLRGRLRRLEEAAEGELMVITQRDGTVRRFPKSASKEAFMNLMDRLGAGEDAPPEHPLIEAVRNSSEAKWAGTVYACDDPAGWIRPVEDLSE